jgi:hypothetical protein
MYMPIGQTDERNPFEFAPAPTAVLLPQTRYFPDGAPHCNGLNVCDVANDLEVHGMHYTNCYSNF